MSNRYRAVALALLAIATGAASRLWPLGVRAWDKSAGDVAYAVLIGALLLAVAPRAPARAIALGSISICFAIEVFQLTGIPARAPRILRIALGDTFSWHDMGCYVVGGLVVAVVHARVTGPKNASG